MQGLVSVNMGENIRLAPHNADIERQLLGAILINNETWHRVSSYLEPAHFFFESHKEIYEKISQLIRAGRNADPPSLKTYYVPGAKIGEMDADKYLFRLAKEATSIINADDFARTIYDLALRRGLINIGEDMVNIAYDSPVDLPPAAQIDACERQLFELAERGRVQSGFVPFGDALSEAVDMAAAAYKRDGHLSGIATGLNGLDRKMGGLQPSDLIILASRPGMGKTSLATNIAYKIASAYQSREEEDGTRSTVSGGIVGFFSLEMSSEQLTTRILSEQAEISSSKIRRGLIDENEYERIVEVSKQLQNMPIFIDQTGGLTLAQLAARARRLKRRHGLDFLVVDYIQLLAGSARHGGNRVQEVTEITTGLKALAKELNIPIVALSQLSRQVENREEKRPQLSDLRESGSIEQDADIVLFVYREEYYLLEKKPREGTEEFEKWKAKMEEICHKAEIIIAKQRHGPTGIVNLLFQGEFTRFSDIADPQYYQDPQA